MSRRIKIEDLGPARAVLSSWVLSRAAREVQRRGYGWSAVDHTAPGTSQQLKGAFDACRTSRRALPIWAGGCDHSIYVPTAGLLAGYINRCGRFWHDCLHDTLDCWLDCAGELVVGMAQIEEVRRAFGNGLEVLLITADTIGQTAYYQKHGKFPDDQLEFALDFINQTKGALHV